MEIYRFCVTAKVVLGDDIVVSADSYEEAKERAKNIAEDRLDNVPIELGEVVEGELSDLDDDVTFSIW